jgi:hypothetical protein
VRPVDRPIAWVGSDRILLDDLTWSGLRRKVVACKGDVPNQVAWLLAAFGEARGAIVHWWLVERGEFMYLWMVWKKEG